MYMFIDPSRSVVLSTDKAVAADDEKTARKLHMCFVELGESYMTVLTGVCCSTRIFELRPCNSTRLRQVIVPLNIVFFSQCGPEARAMIEVLVKCTAYPEKVLTITSGISG